MTLSRHEASFDRTHATTALSALAAVKPRLPLPVTLYLISVILPVLFRVGPLAMSLLRAYLLVMIVPLTINLIKGKYGRLLFVDYMFFLHILWAVVALAVNNPERVVENIGSAAIEFLGGYVLARAFIRTKEDFAGLIKMLIIIVVCSLPFAIHETITGRPIIIETIRKLPGIHSVLITTKEPRLGLERVQVMFAHPIHYGLFCSAVFSLAFVGMKGILSGVKRYIVSGIIGLCVFFSLSSGALLPIILQIFLIMWAASFHSIKQRWLILFGLIIFAYVSIDILSNRTPIKVFMSYATFSAHNAYWRSLIFQWGMVNVWANPIFGIGLNDWVRPPFMNSGSMDNFWLVMAVRYGIPGFILIAAGYFWAIWKIGWRNFDNDPMIWQFRRAWMFTFIGLSFTLSTVHIWTAIYSFTFFLFGAGIWFITVEPETNAKETAKTNRTVARLTRGAPQTTRSDAPQRQRAPTQPRKQTHKYTRFPPSDPDNDQK